MNASTKKASWPRANASNCCSTREAFEELDKFVTHHCTDFGMEQQKPLGDGFITGYGRIDGRLVYVFAQDFTVFGGSLSEANASKICKVMDLAMRAGAPVIGLNDSGGARIQEGVMSLAGYADIFLRNTLASGVIPQISAIMGPCAGGAVYSPAITDFIFMTARYLLHVRHRSGRHQDGDARRGDQARTGRRHDAQCQQRRRAFCRADDAECLAMIRELFGFLPSNNVEDPPRRAPADPRDRADSSLNAIVPEDRHVPYDMKDVIHAVVDDALFF